MSSRTIPFVSQARIVVGAGRDLVLPQRPCYRVLNDVVEYMSPRNFEGVAGVPRAEQSAPERKREAAREWVRIVEDGFLRFKSPIQTSMRKIGNEEVYLELTAGLLQAVNDIAALYRSKLDIDDETWDEAMNDVLERE